MSAKTIPATLCEHANECPRMCPCTANCYCRREGSCKARTAKTSRAQARMSAVAKRGTYLLLDSALFAEIAELNQSLAEGAIVVSIPTQRRIVTFAFPDESSMTGEVVFPAGKLYLRPSGSFSMRTPNAKANDSKRKHSHRRKNPSPRMPA